MRENETKTKRKRLIVNIQWHTNVLKTDPECV